MRVPTSFALAILFTVISLPAMAGPDIDVVYGDDIARRGEVAAEMAVRWSQSAKSGAFAGRSMWQGVGELSYGLSDNMNVGFKLPLTRVDGTTYAHGALAEVKYVAPHASSGFYWGGEIEAGSIKAIGEERAFSVEAFPVLGYRTGRFHFVGNPGVEYSSEGDDKGWEFTPKAKASYSINDRHAVGVEYHIDAGKFGSFGARGKRSEVAYLTWDTKIASRQLSVALGHGTTHASDRWAFRIGIELDD